MKRRLADRQGTTLLEMLAYLVISLVILNMGLVTFLRTGRIAAAASQGLLQAQSEQRFAENFARLVRGADSVVDRLGEFETDGSQVILKTSHGYRAIGMPGGILAVWDIEESGGGYRIGEMRTFPSAFAAATFAYDTPPPATRTVTLRLQREGAPEDDQKARDIVVSLRSRGALP